MTYITELAVSINVDQEQALRNQGFKSDYVDLNQGAGGNKVYLWYKKGTCDPITRLQVAFMDDMNKGLRNAGYIQVDGNLNAGNCGEGIFLWYYKGTTEYDNPILELKVTTYVEDETPFFKNGWERLAYDLNRNCCGNQIHLWALKEKKMYISDITATTSFGTDDVLFNDGYTRVDEDVNRNRETNKDNSGFIWYRCSESAEEGFSDLDVSTNNKEEESLQQRGYTSLSVNLNEGAGGNQIYLWYKKGSDHHISTLTMITVGAKGPYEKAGIRVIGKSLNTGNNGTPLYLAFP
ncbi:uncharacterized protein LOC114840708 [Esox lucius]|uniref:uncharacterized protein LOC114840708 n=1 Tax=Esox lucius TaxID=8010 RepID=UPI0014775349|nr:uncharacterized protein LOC114840708 [Esox lucius]